jgi:hypothetical protein
MSAIVFCLTLSTTRRQVRINLDRAAAQNLQLEPGREPVCSARRRAWTAVHDPTAPREDLLHRLVGRRGRSTGAVRAGGRERSAERETSACAVGCDDWRTAHTRPRRAPTEDRAAPAARSSARRPVALHQLDARAAARPAELARAWRAVDQHRDRLAVPALERAQPRERQLVERVDAQTVERLGRIGDDLAPRSAAPRTTISSANACAINGSAASAAGWRANLGVAVEDLLAARRRSASTRLPASGSADRDDLRGEQARVLGSRRRDGRDGMPGGICTVDSSESSPPGCPARSGTPITGASCAPRPRPPGAPRRPRRR